MTLTHSGAPMHLLCEQFRRPDAIRVRVFGPMLLVVAMVTSVVEPVFAIEPCASSTDEAVISVVRNRLEVLRTMDGLSAAGETIRARMALPDFYSSRAWALAWVDGGRPSSCAAALVQALRRAEEDALDPADYHLGPVTRLLEVVRGGGAPPQEQADLDLLLTDAFLTLGSHLYQGRVNPVSLEAEWLANRRQLDMAPVLEDALTTGDVAGALIKLRPTQPGYRRLRERLAELRSIAGTGGWGEVAGGPTLHPGESDSRVVALRRRLRASGDLKPGDDEGGALFDRLLAGAVAGFQLRHGLDPDSAVGERTLEALNVPAAERLRQVAVNLERWRWLPADLGRVHIRVNIAAYELEVWEEGSVVLDMRAIVGRAYRQTPMFSASMTYLVLAPFWHVPPGIAANDKLPELRRNPDYLSSQNMTLLSQATNEPVDLASVDLQGISGAEFNRRYRLRQDPGPMNALGKVKFMFPNPHNVYLHDTPSRELFSHTERAFSSGCIRLQRPLDLAEYLLRGDPQWTPERIRAVADGTRETTVRLTRPVPVHLLYWTVFVDDEGVIQFRPDLYGRDTRVLRALQGEPPGP